MELFGLWRICGHYADFSWLVDIDPSRVRNEFCRNESLPGRMWIRALHVWVGVDLKDLKSSLIKTKISPAVFDASDVKNFP